MNSNSKLTLSPLTDMDSRSLTLNLFNLQEKYSELLERSHKPYPSTMENVNVLRENEILVSQLLQAQTAIESYHNFCVEIIMTLESTEHSLNRAQAILEKLTTVRKNTGSHSLASI